MKKVFFSTPGVVFANIADCAKINSLLGSETVIVKCSEEICHCWGNMERNKGLCYLCKRQVDKFVKEMPSSVRVVSINDYAREFNNNELHSLSFKYNNLQEIKHIEYKGVNIGYGCLATYVSRTRNLEPLLDNAFREYFDMFLKSTCCLVYCQLNILKKEKPDHIYFFNGRLSHVRPLVEMAKKLNIEYTCTEGIHFFEGKIYQNNYENMMPHSIIGNTKLISNAWDDISVSQKEKEWLGNLFFQSKINGSYTGDINYVAGQNQGKLPVEWDASKKNYVIFNSSEDESFSIGEEYDSKKLFNSQIEGITYIAEQLKGRDDIHLYLRIHPNLKNIKYKYHTDLFTFEKKYSNMTVIPGNSSISSYSLMNAADRIIVFGSTIGIESAYSGKAVINLAAAAYSNLDVVYNPKTPEELSSLLHLDVLPFKANRLHLLMFGYYWMRTKRLRTVYYSYDFKPYSFLGKKLLVSDIDRIFHSKTLYLLIQKLIKTLCSHVKIPLEEAITE